MDSEDLGDFTTFDVVTINYNTKTKKPPERRFSKRKEGVGYLSLSSNFSIAFAALVIDVSTLLYCVL